MPATCWRRSIRAPTRRSSTRRSPTRERDQAQLANAQANLAARHAAAGEGLRHAAAGRHGEGASRRSSPAAVKSDQAVIENARVQLGYTRMTSPIDGVTGIRQIDIGNIIHPTDANGLVVVTQLAADLGDLHAARDGPAADPAGNGARGR